MLIIKENANQSYSGVQIKPTVRYHLTAVIMPIIKKSTNTGEDVEKREPSYTVDGNENCYSHCGEQYGDNS